MGKKRICLQCGRTGFNPWLGKSPGEEQGNPLYSCLEDSMDIGTWWATVYGIAKSWIQLSDLRSNK